jgi:hypothetical protein
VAQQIYSFGLWYVDEAAVPFAGMAVFLLVFGPRDVEPAV